MVAVELGNAKLVEVGCPILDIKKEKVALAQAGDKGGESHFGHVANAMEFGFGEKSAAEMDAVGAASQLALDPNFDRVSMAFAV